MSNAESKDSKDSEENPLAFHAGYPASCTSPLLVYSNLLAFRRLDCAKEEAAPGAQNCAQAYLRDQLINLVSHMAACRGGYEAKLA